jgi:hypothetical protein
MSHASGIVELSAADIKLALQAMQEEESMISCIATSHRSAESVAQHESYRHWVSSWVRRFYEMIPGRVYFSEVDIGRLIGILFNCYKPRVARSYRRAVLENDYGTFSMIYDLRQLEDLEMRMRNPEAVDGTIIGLNTVNLNSGMTLARAR